MKVWHQQRLVGNVHLHLKLRLRRQKQIFVEVSIFQRGGPLQAQISDTSPTNLKTRVITLSCGIKISANVVLFRHKARMWQKGRQNCDPQDPGNIAASRGKTHYPVQKTKLIFFGVAATKHHLLHIIYFELNARFCPFSQVHRLFLVEYKMQYNFVTERCYLIIQ